MLKILLVVLIWLVPCISIANHETIPILSDVMLTGGGECFFNKKGEMVKNGEVPKPCLVGFSASTSKWYAIIQSPNADRVIEVIEMDLDKKVNTSVWRYGVRI